MRKAFALPASPGRTTYSRPVDLGAVAREGMAASIHCRVSHGAGLRVAAGQALTFAVQYSADGTHWIETSEVFQSACSSDCRLPEQTIALPRLPAATPGEKILVRVRATLGEGAGDYSGSEATFELSPAGEPVCA